MLAGTLKVNPASVVNDPLLPTLTVVALIVMAVISVLPWYRLAVTLRPVPGVKPVPAIETPVGMLPATMFEAPNVMAGVPKTVRVVVAELPDASVTTMIRTPGAVVEETLNPTFAIKLPFASVTTVTPAASADAGVVLVSSHVVTVPLTVSVCSEFAAKPLPAMVTFAPGLTATGCVNWGMIVYVAVADAPLAPTTLTMCAPAVAWAGSTKPESMSIAPFVLTTVRPTGVVAVRVVASNFTVNASLALNPEPVKAIVTALPKVPEVGVIDSAAAATLIVVVAELIGAPPLESDSCSVYEPGM